jgi:hypothetical protein
VQFKYHLKRHFSSAHLVKASKLDNECLSKEVWNPIRKHLSESSVFFLKRAIRLPIRE